jgi:DNA replication and repair protein RecR
MAFFPAALDNLIDRFASLPGIGRKSAQRLAFYVLSLPDEEAGCLCRYERSQTLQRLP